MIGLLLAYQVRSLLMSRNVEVNKLETLTNGYNVRLETAPPRRGDAKAVVESCFRTIQAEFKPYAPGIVQGHRIKKHGESDYRLEAALTLKEFTQIYY